MEPFEIMVSESQERMLCVVEPGRVDEVLALRDTWEVHGTVDRRGHRHAGTCGSSTAASSSATCRSRRSSTTARSTTSRPRSPSEPLYPPPPATLAPGASTRVDAARADREPEHRLAPAAVRAVRPDRAVAHRAPPGGGRRRGARAARTAAALAASIDGNGRRVAADPYWGTVGVVLECASNLACVGAEPLGTTNNLNFGNPEKPHIAWQLTEAVRGIGDACRALEAPIVGGNVSLYNEGASAGPIYPTPVIGMVGRLPDAERAGRLGFAQEGDAIAIAGHFHAVARRQRAGQAARRGAPGRAARGRHRRGARGAGGDPRGRPRGPARRQRPRHRRGRLRRRARRVLPGGRASARRSTSARRERPAGRTCSARAPAGSSSPGTRPRSPSSPSACRSTSFGVVGGDALHVAIAGERARRPARRAARGARRRCARFFP